MKKYIIIIVALISLLITFTLVRTDQVIKISSKYFYNYMHNKNINFYLHDITGNLINGLKVKHIELETASFKLNIDNLVISLDFPYLSTDGFIINKLEGDHIDYITTGGPSERGIDITKLFIDKINDCQIKNLSVMTNDKYTINTNFSLKNKNSQKILHFTYLSVRNEDNLVETTSGTLVFDKYDLYANFNELFINDELNINFTIEFNLQSKMVIRAHVYMLNYDTDSKNIGKFNFTDNVMQLEVNKNADGYILTGHSKMQFNDEESIIHLNGTVDRTFNSILLKSDTIGFQDGSLSIDGEYIRKYDKGKVHINTNNVTIDDISVNGDYVCDIKLENSRLNCQVSMHNVEIKGNNIDKINGEVNIANGSITLPELYIESKSINGQLNDFVYNSYQNYNFSFSFDIKEDNNLASIFNEINFPMNFDSRISGSLFHSEENTKYSCNIEFIRLSYKNMFIAENMSILVDQDAKKLSTSISIPKLSTPISNFANIHGQYTYKDGIHKFAIDNLEKDKENTILINGISNDNDKTIIIDNFTATNNLSTYNFDNLIIDYDSLISISDAKLKINNGELLISLNYFNEDNYNYSLNFDNLVLDDIGYYLFNSRRINGVAFGSLYSNNYDNLPIQLYDIKVLNGKVDDIPFELFEFISILNNDKYTISKLNLINNESSVNISGWMHKNYFTKDSESKVHESLDINILSKNFELSNLNRYINMPQKISGELNSTIRIYGDINSPNVSFDANITDPMFDKISGKKLFADINYQKNKLSITNISLVTSQGRYFGRALIPSKLNIIEQTLEPIAGNEIDVSFAGTSYSLELLLPYINDVKSINGDISWQLELSGLYENPKKTGQISMSNVEIDIMQLDNKLSNVSGIGKLNNNYLWLNDVTGSLFNDEIENNLFTQISDASDQFFGIVNDPNINNTEISGSINLDSFFNPEYALRLIGKNAYIESTLGQMEGDIDFNLFITGKDSIAITGLARPKASFTFFDIFKDYNMKIEELDSWYTTYDIELDMSNGVRLYTPPVNCYLEGNITISSQGLDNWKYFGQLNILDGTFKYNGNDFNNATGTILLNPINSPYVDISAETSLYDNEIEVSFKGYTNNPSLSIETIEQSNLYTQSDLLQMLTFKDNSLDYDTNGERVGNFLSNYIEGKIEENILHYTDLDEFQLQHKGSFSDGFDDGKVNIYFGKRLNSNLYFNSKIGFNETTLNQYQMSYRLNKNESIIARLDQDNNWQLNYRFKYSY